MIHALRTTVQGAVLLFLAAVALFFLAVGVGPLTGRYLPYTVLTSSMAPTMPAGSVVFVVPVQAADLKLGDVITYRIPVENRRVVTHRIVEIVESGPEPTVVTKGDANDAPDAWSTRLVGGSTWKAVGAVPQLGYALQTMRHPTVITVSRTVLPLATAVVWLASIWWPHRREADSPNVPAPTGAEPVRRKRLVPRFRPTLVPAATATGPFRTFTAASPPGPSA